MKAVESSTHPDDGLVVERDSAVGGCARGVGGLSESQTLGGEAARGSSRNRFRPLKLGI